MSPSSSYNDTPVGEKVEKKEFIAGKTFDDNGAIIITDLKYDVLKSNHIDSEKEMEAEQEKQLKIKL